MPLGAIVLLAGREGIGKTILGYTLAADITRGNLAGIYRGTPHSVIVAATEDSWEHTIVPRLMAAGADLERVYRVDVATSEQVDTGLSLPRDLAALEREIGTVGAAMIILDPLMSRLDASLDSHKNAEVRQALEPLATLADRSGACVLGLIHVNKSPSQDPRTTLMGSRAFAAVARAVLFAMTDPHEESTRLLGQPKNNLGRSDLPTLSFRIIGAKVAATVEGEVWTGKLEWTGQTSRSRMESPPGWIGRHGFVEERPYLTYHRETTDPSKRIMPQQSVAGFRITLPDAKKDPVQVTFDRIPFEVAPSGAGSGGLVSLDRIPK
jgi:hypothetical protein